jgi:hypothetical protein
MHGFAFFWIPTYNYSHALDIFPKHLWLLAEFKKIYLNPIQSVFICVVSLAIFVTRVSLSCIISSALNRRSVCIKRPSLISCSVCNGPVYGLFIFSSSVL